MLYNVVKGEKAKKKGRSKMGNFCSSCGNQLEENSRFCNACGKPTNAAPNFVPPPPPQYQTYYHGAGMSYRYDFNQQLADKINVKCIMWWIVAGLQYLTALFYVLGGWWMMEEYIIYDTDYPGFVIMGLVVLITAIVNTLVCIKDREFRDEVRERPVGIIERIMPLGKCIGLLIYNIFFGGIVGIILSIYNFSIRRFVIRNQQEFMRLEAECLEKAV